MMCLIDVTALINTAGQDYVVEWLYTTLQQGNRTERFAGCRETDDSTVGNAAAHHLWQGSGNVYIYFDKYSSTFLRHHIAVMVRR